MKNGIYFNFDNLLREIRKAYYNLEEKEKNLDYEKSQIKSTLSLLSIFIPKENKYNMTDNAIDLRESLKKRLRYLEDTKIKMIDAKTKLLENINILNIKKNIYENNKDAELNINVLGFDLLLKNNKLTIKCFEGNEENDENLTMLLNILELKKDEVKIVNCKNRIEGNEKI